MVAKYCDARSRLPGFESLDSAISVAVGTLLSLVCPSISLSLK